MEGRIRPASRCLVEVHTATLGTYHLQFSDQKLSVFPKLIVEFFKLFLGGGRGGGATGFKRVEARYFINCSPAGMINDNIIVRKKRQS